MNTTFLIFFELTPSSFYGFSDVYCLMLWTRLDVIPIFDMEDFEKYRYQRRSVHRRHPSEVVLPISLHPSLDFTLFLTKEG